MRKRSWYSRLSHLAACFVGCLTDKFVRARSFVTVPGLMLAVRGVTPKRAYGSEVDDARCGRWRLP